MAVTACYRHRAPRPPYHLSFQHDSSIYCDELVSLPKSALTNFVGTLSPQKIDALNRALAVALELPD